MILGSPDWPAERLWLWRIGFPPVSALARLFLPAEVTGLERVPRAGGYILASNHIDWKDPPWIEFALGLPIRYMAKQEAFDLPVLGAIMRGIGCFPVRRGDADRRAIATALRVLESGLPLGFFPEGHRSESGALLRAHPGIALLALRSGAPIVPVGVSGTKRARIGAFWRRDVRIAIGEPFLATDLPEAAGGDHQAVADAIMRRIAALISLEMRGQYA